MPLIYNCYAPLQKHAVFEYSKSKEKTSFKPASQRAPFSAGTVEGPRTDADF